MDVEVCNASSAMLNWLVLNRIGERIFESNTISNRARLTVQGDFAQLEVSCRDGDSGGFIRLQVNASDLMRMLRSEIEHFEYRSVRYSDAANSVRGRVAESDDPLNRIQSGQIAQRKSAMDAEKFEREATALAEFHHEASLLMDACEAMLQRHEKRTPRRFREI